jgi:hypothetical protein
MRKYAVVALVGAMLGFGAAGGQPDVVTRTVTVEVPVPGPTQTVEVEVPGPTQYVEVPAPPSEGASSVEVILSVPDECIAALDAIDAALASSEVGGSMADTIVISYWTEYKEAASMCRIFKEAE